MSKKLNLILLSIILPLTLITFYALDRADSRDAKISSENKSGGDKGKGSLDEERKYPKGGSSEKVVEFITINLMDLNAGGDNSITMNLGQKIIFEQNIEADKISFSPDSFSIEPYKDELTQEDKYLIKAEIVTSATLSVEFEGITYSIVIEVKDFYVNPERSIDINAGVPESQKVIAAIINKPLAEALIIIKKAGVKHRIVSEDGLSYAVTMDYSPSRINLVLINNIIQDATLG
jgi:hypothetical protein